MPANITIPQSDATAALRGGTPGAVIMTPASDVSDVFSAGPEVAFLMAHGLTGTDSIRVMIVSGPGSGTHFTPFRPTGEDPPRDVILSAGRTYLPLYFPGRYRLERLVGATNATVYLIKAIVAHDAGTFYNEVTGETVVNSIDVGTVSESFELTIDPTFGDVLVGLELNIDPGANNLVTEEAGGISVVAVDTVSALDTSTINMTVTQVDPNIAVVSGDVRISATVGNLITANADGLYAPPPPVAITEITAVDSATVDIEIGLGGGPNERTIEANVLISADAGNVITAEADGIYASRQAEQTLVSATYTFGDTDDQTLSFVTAFRDSLSTALPVGFLTVPGDASLSQTYAEVSLEFYASAYTSSNPGALGVDVAYTTDFVGDLIFQGLVKVDGYSGVLAAEPYHLGTLQFRQKFVNAQTLYVNVESSDVGVTDLFCIASVRVIGP